MSKIVLLVSQDKKTVAQVSRWLKELPEDIALQSAASLDELDEKFYALAAGTPDGAEVKPPDGVLRLLIFDVGIFGSTDPTDYISQTKDRFQKSPLGGNETPIKVLILSFDQASLPLRTFIHKDIDDLVMKPLDHQLFLQKAGMMVADKSSTAGNFLFKQKANFTIEMAKEARITKLSEFGLTISNPTPLAPGVFAHLYSPIFGTKKKGSVWCRVFNTRRDPKNPGSYLCFFTFYGMQNDQLMNYRRVLRDKRKELRMTATGYDPYKVPGAIRHAAVIDRNESNAQIISEGLSKNFVNLKTYTFSSYAQFLKAVTGSAVPFIPSLKDLPEGTVKNEPFRDSQITLILTAEGAELIRTEPAPREDDEFCLVPLQKLIGTSRWQQFMLPSDKDEYEEFLLTLQRGSKAQAVLYLKDKSEQFHAVLFRGESIRGNTGERLLKIDLRALTEEESAIENDRRKKESAVFPQIDAIYIDATSIRDFDKWYDSLREVLKRANLLIGDKVSVCLMADEKSEVRPEDLRNPNINDFMYKPVDRRFVIAKAPTILNDLVSSNDTVDLSFTPVDMPVKIAKEIQLSELAEFGFQIRSRIPLKEGIFLRFFSHLFLDESGEGVLARCTACEPDPDDKESFGCFFSFFGVSDAQLKHIRNWIREDYVSKKDEAAG